MLFNSYGFIFLFLPVSLAGFFGLARFGRIPAAIWLVLASFVFYSCWRPAFLPVLLVSVSLNYIASVIIHRTKARLSLQRAALTAAIGLNLLGLCYYKYLSASLGFLSQQFTLELVVPDITLPLGISFFTFTQIGYLIDVQQDVAEERDLLSYMLFAIFFPHLIAGPILHNREVMPQFAAYRAYQFSAVDFGSGITIFVIGLLKKTLLADPSAVAVAPGFAHPDSLGFFTAWHVALSYSMQLYFDFSGYSDMAIGLARMFNIKFPANFESPFKATSMIEFWQRWHMTLTRYITLYIYNPIALWVSRRRLGRTNKTERSPYATRRGFLELVAFPTFVTILLAGIWHGAGFTFIVYGLLHAMFLIINHWWRIFGPKRKRDQGSFRKSVSRAWRMGLVYLCALSAMIFFRAQSCGDALSLIGGMLSLHGEGIRASLADGIRTVGPSTIARETGWLVLLFGIVWLMPNTQQIMVSCEPVLGKVRPPYPVRLRWSFSRKWALVTGCAATLAIIAMGGTTEFIYFQF